MNDTNNSLTVQINELTQRASGYQRALVKMAYSLGVLGVAVFTFYWLRNYYGLDLTEIDIPKSLNKGPESLSDILTPFNILGPAFSIFKPMFSLVCVLFALRYILGLVKGESNNAYLIGFLFWSGAVVIGNGFFIESSDDIMDYDAVASKILHHDLSTPISYELIKETSQLEERYILGQAAILSHANFPTQFYKNLSSDIGQQSMFQPSIKAAYSIEMQAFGAPVSDRVVKEVARAEGLEKTLKVAQVGGVIMINLLILISVVLLWLRLTLKKRLNAISCLLEASVK